MYNNLSKLLLFIVFFTVSERTISQNINTLNFDTINKVYTEYITPLNDFIPTGINLNVLESNITLNKKPTGISIMRYVPFSRGFFGVSLGLRNLAFDAKFKLQTTKGGISNEFRLSYANRPFRITAFYRNNSGYNLQTIDSLTLKENTFPRYDVKIHTYLIKGVYFLNHKKFSHKAAYEQSEIQTKSAGSFMFGVNFLKFDVLSDSNLYSYPLGNLSVNDSSKIVNIYSQSIGPIVGYTYSLVFFKRLYFNLLLAISSGYAWDKTMTDKFVISTNKFSAFNSLDFNFSTGYNGKRFFFTFTASSLGSFTKPSLSVSDFSMNLRLGFRINSSKKSKPS